MKIDSQIAEGNRRSDVDMADWNAVVCIKSSMFIVDIPDTCKYFNMVS